MKWLKPVVLGLSMLLVCSLGLSSQALPSTSPPSSEAIAQLKADLLQLQVLKAQMQNYQATWQALLPALTALNQASQTDSESLTQLTQALSSSDLDSQTVSKLSTKLSGQFKELSKSYKMAKLTAQIAVPTLVVAIGAFAASYFTQGFTKF
jgi:uncharacterized protein HemY